MHPDVASDIIAQVRSDYPAQSVPAILDQLARTSRNMRVLRCIVFAARGHVWYLNYLCKLAKIDFRDVIMAGEYDRFDIHLYDFSKPIPDAKIAEPYGANRDGPDAMTI